MPQPYISGKLFLQQTVLMRLLESDIKAILINYLLEKGHVEKYDTIVSEMTIDNFARRLDLATINSKGLYAYEIKSVADTLNRLEDQIEKYSEFFDKITIVAAEKHIPKITQLVEARIAVWAVSDKGIRIVKRGLLQKYHAHSKLAKITTLEELKKISRECHKKPVDYSRSAYEAMLNELPKRTTHQLIKGAIQARYNDSSSAFWASVGTNEIRAENIEELSRFLPQRRALEEKEKDKQAFWDKWCEKMKSIPDDPMLANLMRSSRENIFGEVPESVRYLLATEA